MPRPPPYRRNKTGPWRDTGDGVDRAPLVFRRRPERDDSSDTLVKVVAAILVIALVAGVAGLLKANRAQAQARAVALAAERAEHEARNAEASLAQALRLQAVQAQRANPPQRQLYRCMGSQGLVSVQDVPCAQAAQAGHQQTITISAHEESRRQQEWTRLQAEARLKEAQANLAAALGGSSASPGYRATADSGESNAMRCQSAKARRDEAYRIAGNNRTFDMIRRWNDIVYEACKGT
jgi:hypothetical protein